MTVVQYRTVTMEGNLYSIRCYTYHYQWFKSGRTNKLSRCPNFSRCRPAFWFYNAQPGISYSFELQKLRCHLLKFFQDFGTLHLLRSENRRGHFRNIRTVFIVFYIILTVPVRTVIISYIVCILWYTIYGIHQLLRVSASGCYPQRVNTTKVYKPACQYRFWHANLGSASSRAEPRLRCWLIYLCCNDSLRMVCWLSERCSFWPI